MLSRKPSSLVYQLQYIDCSRLRSPGLSSVLEHARAVGAGGGGVGAGRVVITLPSPLGPAAAARADPVRVAGALKL